MAIDSNSAGEACGSARKKSKLDELREIFFRENRMSDIYINWRIGADGIVRLNTKRK